MKLSQKPIVWFDLDGTLVNYNERLYEEIQNSKKISQEIKNILSDINNRKHIDLSLSIDYDIVDIKKGEIQTMINDIRQTEEFFKSLSFRPGVIKTIKELNQIFNIHFVSKPSEEITSNSEIIKRQLIENTFWYKNGTKKLVLTHDKTMRRWDIIVDDSPDIDQWARSPSRKQILMDQPHNQNIDKPRLFLDKQNEWEQIIKKNLYSTFFIW